MRARPTIASRFVLVAALAAAALVSVGCTIEEVQIEGFECLDGRCPRGFACDLRRGEPGRCISQVPLDAGADAGSIPPGVDAGRRDAGPHLRDAGPGNGCASPGHLLCDDFESGSIMRWGVSVDGASLVSATGTAARSGDYAVAATSAADGMAAFLTLDAFDDPTITDQWVRAYFLFPRGAGTELTIMELAGAAPSTGVSLHIDSYRVMSWYSSYDGGDVFEDPIPISITEDVWTCFELHVRQGGVGVGAIEVFVDGAQVGGWAGASTASTGVLPTVNLGARSFAPSGVRLVYLDDVVLSTVRPGCD